MKRLLQLLPAAAGLWFVLHAGGRIALLRRLFPAAAQHSYTRIPLPQLLLEHLQLVLVSSSGAAVLGILIGVMVTRRAGRVFLPLVRDGASIMQTLPPVAVLALAVPLLGFGTRPALLALVLYSILPVLSNTIAGLEDVPPAVRQAASGMGMTPLQRLLWVELPIAARVILAGIRISVVINVGTATVGTVVGAGGLGVPIVAGLVRDNLPFILEGALAAAWVAYVLDRLLAEVVHSSYSPQSGLDGR
ncbi:ABC transporter permease [Spirochaeta africana]|uniref:ABC-type proline/glycine betaine transport system, permease component n=1 Tax=Spirochaeta africana (strain ATCC 700263 / DSM 8902 / Z-7692) TaxID=889378 RepID=H9UI42_SPIAZ|nr:ABC transporter permease [Spirochaeta africana]AFG37185.1 ABC-type proline/glycine betaine transport system, permease component [Spirochaeta africana DSM 8902]